MILSAPKMEKPQTLGQQGFQCNQSVEGVLNLAQSHPECGACLSMTEEMENLWISPQFRHRKGFKYHVVTYQWKKSCRKTEMAHQLLILSAVIKQFEACFSAVQ